MNQGFSYYFCLIEESRSRSGSIPLTSGLGGSKTCESGFGIGTMDIGYHGFGSGTLDRGYSTWAFQANSMPKSKRFVGRLLGYSQWWASKWWNYQIIFSTMLFLDKTSDLIIFFRFRQCCGSGMIFFGSDPGSGSDFSVSSGSDPGSGSFTVFKNNLGINFTFVGIVSPYC